MLAEALWDTWRGLIETGHVTTKMFSPKKPCQGDDKHRYDIYIGYLREHATAHGICVATEHVKLNGVHVAKDGIHLSKVGLPQVVVPSELAGAIHELGGTGGGGGGGGAGGGGRASGSGGGGLLPQISPVAIGTLSTGVHMRFTRVGPSIKEEDRTHVVVCGMFLANSWNFRQWRETNVVQPG